MAPAVTAARNAVAAPLLAATLPPGRHHIRIAVDLDWSGEGHHAPVALPCELCGAGTQARLRAGVPAHKRCVEQQLEGEYVAQVHDRIRSLGDLQPIPFSLIEGVASC